MVSIKLYDCHHSFPQDPKSDCRIEYFGVGLQEQSLKDCQAVWEMAPGILAAIEISFLHLRVASDRFQIQPPALPSALFLPSQLCLFTASFPDLRQMFINPLHLHGV